MNSHQQSPTTEPSNTASKRVIGGLMGLLIIAGSVTAVVSLVEQFTREQITANQAARTLKIVTEVLPSRRSNNKPIEEIHQLTDGLIPNTQKQLPIYLASVD